LGSGEFDFSALTLNRFQCCVPARSANRCSVLYHLATQCLTAQAAGFILTVACQAPSANPVFAVAAVSAVHRGCVPESKPSQVSSTKTLMYPRLFTRTVVSCLEICGRTNSLRKPTWVPKKATIAEKQQIGAAQTSKLAQG